MKKIITAIALLILATSYNNLCSQEIRATVTVNMEQLMQESRVNVSSMERDLTNYLNNQRFTGKEWEGPPIPVDVSIYLTGGNQGNYAARLFIVSRRMLLGDEQSASVALKLVDSKWAFNYSMGATHSYNPMRFDRFISLLDYYMLLIIGYDLDTYGELDGTAAYEAAKQICRLGASQNADGYETYSMPGELTRWNLVTELTDIRYEPFRRIIFEYYVDGLDNMAKNPEKALDALAEVIADIADFKQNRMTSASALLQVFFYAKSQELASLFRGYKKNRNVFKDLIYLDPTNTSLYEEARDAR